MTKISYITGTEEQNIPTVLNVGDPSELSEGELSLLIAKQRLEIEEEITNKIRGIGNLRSKKIQNQLDVVNDALEVMRDRELSQAEKAHELAIVEEGTIRGIYNIGALSAKDARAKNKAKRKTEKEERKVIRKKEKAGTVSKEEAKKLKKETRGGKTGAGKFLQKVAKGAGKALKTVAKIATAPQRLAVKAILEVALPSASPFFLYLFVNDPVLIVKLPTKARAKRKTAETIANFIVEGVGMKREHFMGIVRNGIMKHMKLSPESILSKSLGGVKVTGIGVIPVAAIPAVLKIIKKIISLFKKTFKGKIDLTEKDAPNPEEDFEAGTTDVIDTTTGKTKTFTEKDKRELQKDLQETSKEFEETEDTGAVRKPLC